MTLLSASRGDRWKNFGVRFGGSVRGFLVPSQGLPGAKKAKVQQLCSELTEIAVIGDNGSIGMKKLTKVKLLNGVVTAYMSDKILYLVYRGALLKRADYADAWDTIPFQVLQLA